MSVIIEVSYILSEKYNFSVFNQLNSACSLDQNWVDICLAVYFLNNQADFLWLNPV